MSDKRNVHKACVVAERDPNCREIRRRGSHVTFVGPTGHATLKDEREAAKGTWRSATKQAEAAGLSVLAKFMIGAMIALIIWGAVLLGG